MKILAILVVFFLLHKPSSPKISLQLFKPAKVKFFFMCAWGWPRISFTKQFSIFCGWQDDSILFHGRFSAGDGCVFDHTKNPNHLRLHFHITSTWPPREIDTFMILSCWFAFVCWPRSTNGGPLRPRNDGKAISFYWSVTNLWLSTTHLPLLHPSQDAIYKEILVLLIFLFNNHLHLHFLVLLLLLSLFSRTVVLNGWELWLGTLGRILVQK